MYWDKTTATRCNPIAVYNNKLSAPLGPGVYSATNRNDYQRQKNNVSR
jgi:hypothetical protein